MSENGKIYTAGKNFTLPPALTALTNSNSARLVLTQLSHIEAVKEHRVRRHNKQQHGERW